MKSYEINFRLILDLFYWGREALNQLRPSEKISFVDKNGKTSLLILCDRRFILSDSSIRILQGQMLEKRLQKLAEGLNLELKRTAEIIYLKWIF